MSSHAPSATRPDWFAELVRESVEALARTHGRTWRKVSEDVYLRNLEETLARLRDQVKAEEPHLGNCLGEAITLATYAFFLSDRIRMFLEQLDPDVRRTSCEAFIYKARQHLMVAIDAHEASGCPGAPAGEACGGGRRGAIAYLAHCLGLRRDDLPLVASMMEGYDRRCASGEGNCHG